MTNVNLFTNYVPYLFVMTVYCFIRYKEIRQENFLFGSTSFTPPTAASHRSALPRVAGTDYTPYRAPRAGGIVCAADSSTRLIPRLPVNVIDVRLLTGSTHY